MNYSLYTQYRKSTCQTKPTKGHNEACNPQKKITKTILKNLVLTLPATDPQKKFNKNIFFSEVGFSNPLFADSNVVQYIPVDEHIYLLQLTYNTW